MASHMRGSRQGVISLLLICLIVPPLALAVDFWTKKPYQNWSAEETRRLLEDSPWATTCSVNGLQTSVSEGAANPGAYRGEMEENPTIAYTIQFRSARPIREAQIRSSQLSSHYDAMGAAQKAAFDASASKFLAAEFLDRVLVSVTFHTNVGNYESLLRNYWASQSMAKLSMSVYLNTKAEKLSLIGYSFKDDTFQFTFPRPKQVSPDEKISLEFVHPTIDVIGQQRILQVFGLKKMLVNGQPSF